MAEEAYRKFFSVSTDDTPDKDNATVFFHHPDIVSHRDTVLSATVSNRTLTVIANFNGKSHRRIIKNLDIEEEVTMKVEKGKISVGFKKTTKEKPHFDMHHKLDAD